jgi:peptidoglycan/LPS O-acetylase OafA/YrhL
LPIVLIISSIFYLLIEKPCMAKHWPRKLMNWLSSRSAKKIA